MVGSGRVFKKIVAGIGRPIPYPKSAKTKRNTMPKPKAVKAIKILHRYGIEQNKISI